MIYFVILVLVFWRVGRVVMQRTRNPSNRLIPAHEFESRTLLHKRWYISVPQPFWVAVFCCFQTLVWVEIGLPVAVQYQFEKSDRRFWW